MDLFVHSCVVAISIVAPPVFVEPISQISGGEFLEMKIRSEEKTTLESDRKERDVAKELRSLGFPACILSFTGERTLPSMDIGSQSSRSQSVYAENMECEPFLRFGVDPKMFRTHSGTGYRYDQSNFFRGERREEPRLSRRNPESDSRIAGSALDSFPGSSVWPRAKG
jgi:hypothetical protein